MNTHALADKPFAVLDALESLYETREEEVEAFFETAREKGVPYLTSSVDLRHSGLRLAPVDTNLYPAGFQNLSARAELRAARNLKRFVEEHYPKAKRLLIVPESHTRNLPYFENLKAIRRIVETAGLDVRIGSLAEEVPEGQDRLIRKGDWLEVAGFRPDIALLNNDCTSGIPEPLQNTNTPLLPPPSMGWHARKKSVHFAAYAELAKDFATAFGFDPWLFAAEFRASTGIDFKHRDGLDALARAVDEVIATSKAKHAQYGIAHEPYVFVKADAGTYGMGIMTARDGSELLEINKKERNKMHVVKEGAEVHDVIVQEGVATIDTVQGKSAEPMVYMLDGIPIGGMFRVNGARDAYGNLNAAGMEFTGMCDESEEVVDCRQPVRECHFRAYGLIAALAALAAGRERYA